MSKYIDKGTARQHLTDRLIESALNNVGIKADADEVFRSIAEDRLPVWIDELQTYDVVEVRRGRWKIQYGDHEAFGVRPFYRYCSECNEVTVFQYKYCPNCGAKMDEVNRE